MHCADVPVWSDCPFRSNVPAEVTIRRGVVPGFPDDMLIFEVCDGQKHVDVQMTWPEKMNSSLEILKMVVDPCLYNLIGRHSTIE